MFRLKQVQFTNGLIFRSVLFFFHFNYWFCDQLSTFLSKHVADSPASIHCSLVQLFRWEDSLSFLKIKSIWYSDLKVDQTSLFYYLAVNLPLYAYICCVPSVIWPVMECPLGINIECLISHLHQCIKHHDTGPNCIVHVSVIAQLLWTNFLTHSYIFGSCSRAGVHSSLINLSLELGAYNALYRGICNIQLFTHSDKIDTMNVGTTTSELSMEPASHPMVNNKSFSCCPKVAHGYFYIVGIYHFHHQCNRKSAWNTT